jgi:hypothetical protein
MGSQQECKRGGAKTQLRPVGLEVGRPELGAPIFCRILHATLTFQPAGRFRLGAAERLVPLGSKYIAFLPGLRVGWVKWAPGWEGERIAASDTVLVRSARCPQDLAVVDRRAYRRKLDCRDPADWFEGLDPWEFVNFLPMIDADSGEWATFVARGVWDLAAVAPVSQAYGRRRHKFPDEFPIVRLRTKQFWCRTIQIHIPHFDIVDWTRPPGWGGDAYEPPTPVAPMLSRVN